VTSVPTSYISQSQRTFLPDSVEKLDVVSEVLLG